MDYWLTISVNEKAKLNDLITPLLQLAARVNIPLQFKYRGLRIFVKGDYESARLLRAIQRALADGTSSAPVDYDNTL